MPFTRWIAPAALALVLVAAVAAVSVAVERSIATRATSAALVDSLNAARDDAVSAITAQRLAESAASAFELAATVEHSRADSAAAVAKTAVQASSAARAAYRDAAATAPDTCRVVVERADRALSTSDSVRAATALALVSAQAEARNLRAALDTVRPAALRTADGAAQLAHAAAAVTAAPARSLAERLLPRPGIGIVAGMDATGHPNAVAGVLLGWTF